SPAFALAITVGCFLMFGVPTSGEGSVTSFRAFEICVLGCAAPAVDAGCSWTNSDPRAGAVINLSAGRMVLSAPDNCGGGALAAGVTACRVVAASSMGATAACGGAAW